MDSMLTPASDLYSLGCVLYAIHLDGKPPVQTHNSMQTLRTFFEGSLDFKSRSQWHRLPAEVQGTPLSLIALTRRSHIPTPYSPPIQQIEPGLSPIAVVLLIARNQYPQLPRSSHVRVKTEGRESHVPAWSGQSSPYILRRTSETEDTA